MKILVTGGAGYIGSHTAVELLDSGYKLAILDNLSNSKIESLNRIKEITGKDFEFYQADLLDRDSLEEIFKENKIDAVIHFAGLKAVGESVENPLIYYHNNISGTINLLEVMNKHSVKKIVFSSSATVYGNPKSLPIREDFELSVTNPYGATKLMIEEILEDLYESDRTWKISILRYFNPIGAHSSGRIGEDPWGIPNNLMPYVTKVALGELDRLSVFGDDYDTPDGTGVRDYIHVVDLAKGHLCALKKLEEDKGGSVSIFNLGTGRGYSVLELIETFEAATDHKVPYTITGRRPGDIASCYADPKKAEIELGWKATKTLEDMCRDSWNWQVNNPKGYK